MKLIKSNQKQLHCQCWADVDKANVYSNEKLNGFRFVWQGV